MRTALSIAILTVVVIGTAVCVGALTGCRTSCFSAAKTDCSVCPVCKGETVTRAIKACACTKGVCPLCRKVTALDPQQEEILRNYVGISSDVSTMHVCTHCKAVVAKCPECRKQAEVMK